jgi:hypothetical protein
MNLFLSINPSSSLWNSRPLAMVVAASAVALLIATVWIMRRRKRDGRGAAVVCLFLSVALHGLLIYFLPVLQSWGGGASRSTDTNSDSGLAQVTIGDFNPVEELSDSSAHPTAMATPDVTAIVAPLPLPSPLVNVPSPIDEVDKEQSIEPMIDTSVATEESLPSTLESKLPSETETITESMVIDDLLTNWLSDDASMASVPEQNLTEQMPDLAANSALSSVMSVGDVNKQSHVPGLEQNDFGQRVGDAKRLALLMTGGDESTEAAVEAGLRFLAADQRSDGAWDPATSGAGREALTLGTDRGGAGKRATNAITGLALLSMIGAGNTHLEGPYADNVRRGLTYLIRSQKPDGSLAGPATVYEANYCHGMAALAMCEVSAMTGDDSAIRSAAAATQFTVAGQHPTTGGWRYVKGDPGDLSQLGWQAMVLDGARRASIPVNPRAFQGTATFLRSVRSGQSGGLASYRPGEAPTRTMTAEALATRLLLGEQIPTKEIEEAESFILRQPPGVGKDNYYGWYYTSLALHQLQDDAWRTWNAAMKTHLLARQQSNGSWPTDDEWGGYGGRVYSTATATLCLEVYYRHALRRTHLASNESGPEENR